MVVGLLDDHELVIRDLREDLERHPQLRSDVGTTDFLTGILQEHEAMAWTLRSLHGEKVHPESWRNEQEKVPYRTEVPREGLVSMAT